ncbi:hypothetical protein [Pontibacter beigongshangensis]|uniref:hypothetical protein n=1 Tax=Pontibacter beigongshangensis TaxID=2574733 RepID=UPI0016504478|nr:hypothetical protein [Pontibacter beigongshangensis]
MKQIYLLLLLVLLGLRAYGQAHPVEKSDFQAEIASIIYNLNKSYPSSGILYNSLSFKP